MVVNDIIQDTQGFMWFATDGGLSRYDGYGFRHFTHRKDNPHSLADSFIEKLHLDNQGQLWVVSRGGWLHKFDAANEHFLRLEIIAERSQRGKKNLLTSLVNSNDGHIYITSKGFGLFKLNPQDNSLTAQPIAGVDPSATLVAMTPKGNGQFWLALSNRFGVLDPANHTFTITKQPSFGASLTALLSDNANTLWLGTNGKGLYRYNTHSGQYHQFTKRADSLSGDRIQQLLLDNQNTLWIGTFTAGLNRFDTTSGQWTHFAHDPDRPDTLAGKLVRSLYQDASGVIWAGSYNGGVGKLDPATLAFGHYKRDANKPQCLDNNAIYAILQDSQQNLWLSGYGGGLNKVNLTTGQCRQFKKQANNPDSISANSVYALLEDSSGQIWAGTSNGGVSVYNPKTDAFTNYSFADSNTPGQRKGTVYSLFEDSQQHIWIGTLRKGLQRFNPKSKQFVRYQHDDNNPQSLSANTVSAITQDAQGNLWIGTNNGLNQLNPATGTITRFSHQPQSSNSLKDNEVIALWASPAGKLWIGTESGLSLYDIDSGQFTNHSQWPSQRVYAILADSRHTLWLSTSKGLVHFFPATGQQHTYVKEDGLQNNDFTSAAFKHADTGRLFFAGINGFNSFIPANLNSATRGPAVALTDFLLDNRPIRPGVTTKDQFSLPQAINSTTHLQLSYKEQQFAFEFAALSYASPARNQYRYQLEGFNQDWITTDAHNRRATYTNLDPGDYVFKVMAGDHLGRWNEQSHELSLTVLPPPWKTKWAYASYVVLVLSLIYAGYKFRTLQLRRHAAKLEQGIRERTEEIYRQKQTIESLLARRNALFANISHEFRTPLTLILGRIDEILQQSMAQDNHSRLLTVKRNARRLLRMVSQILDLTRLSVEKQLNIRPVRIAALVNVLADGFTTIAREKDLDFSVEIVDDCWLMADSDALEQILLNLLSNAMKYTPKGRSVGIKVTRLSAQQGAIAVSDTGDGIAEHSQTQIFERFKRLYHNAEQVPGSGIGLALVKELVTVQNGEIHLTSEVGRGSTFTVTLPIAANEAKVLEVSPPHLNAMALELTTVEAQPPSENPPKAVANVNDVSVLVIEDNLDMSNYLVDCLKDHYQVDTAYDGQQGVDKALELVPDIIICDVMMPHKDGYEVIEQLKNDEKTSHIPMILLTAKAQIDDRIRGWQTLADEYLTKPFNSAELLMRIDNLLSLRKLLKARFSSQLINDETIAPAPKALIAQPKAIENKEQIFINKLDEVLESCYADCDTKVGQIAKAMAMSERQLHRKLKALTELTASEYLRSYRLKKAAKLLRQGEMVGNVAFDVGIATHAHFSTCFKSQYDMTPKAYQEQYRQMAQHD